MSAFVVGTDHIDYLVSAAQKLSRVSSWYIDPYMDADIFGRTLIDWNIKSVCYRYRDSIDADEFAHYAEMVETYRHTPAPVGAVTVETTSQIIKAVQCLEYQSCEHPEFESSAAHTLLSQITERAIYGLPGMADAQWEWKRPTVPQNV